MRILAAIGAAAGLLLAPATHAASDPGLMLPGAHASASRAGAGVQAFFTVPLGARAQGQGSRLSLRAGPTLTREPGMTRAVRIRVAPLAEFAVRPNHSTTFSLAGAPIAQSFSLAALHDERASRTRSSRKGVSTLGAVGIGLGALAVAGGIALLVLIDEAEDNSE